MGVMKILHVTHQNSAVQMPLNEGICRGQRSDALHILGITVAFCTHYLTV